MKEEIKVPAMGESITEAEVGSLLKPSGSAVLGEEEIIELETEKVNQVLYAPFDGTISWNVSEGDTVKIGDVLGTVDSEGAPAGGPKEKEEEKKEEVPPPAPRKEEKPPQPPPKEEKPLPEGKGKRVMEEEFVASLKQKPKPIKPEPKKPEERVVVEGETRRRMSKIRKTIAGRLVDALHTAAMLTTFNEVDMSAIMALRAKYKELFLKKHGVKLGFMSFFVKAVVEALKAYPDFNSYIDGDEIVERHYFDVGVAVGTERGLFVPVVRACDSLSFAEIESEIVLLAKKAREGKLSIEDLRGGGFTITNGGVYGSLLSTPILNPPQVGILGMHKIQNRPVVVDGEIVVRPMMYLALSYDHRVVDGKEAVTFLVRIKEILEDPSRLLLIDTDGKI
ncbi:MAG: 2-oxoglutarate dehydrogenase complex dihydrolipoyllysine-residue succinyltransferase [Chlamydiales bacterium]|nr:2-oxoglutarate dehydrogenase complex dihydrolipoyllysine-residue succinyltransferase [Chlamydiales bacterium]